MPICPVFGLVSQICPDIDRLHYSTVVCLRIGGRKLAWILSVYRKKITGSWGSVPDSTGGAHDAPPDPNGSHMWCSPPMTCAFGAHSGLWCPNCDHLIPVTCAIFPRDYISDQLQEVNHEHSWTLASVWMIMGTLVWVTCSEWLYSKEPVVDSAVLNIVPSLCKFI